MKIKAVYKQMKNLTDNLKEELIQNIREAVAEKPEGIITSELSALLLEKYPGTDRKVIRNTIRFLLENEELMFINRLGQSMICLNINKTVKISERVSVSPPGRKKNTDYYGYTSAGLTASLPESVNIIIKQGVAFGNGIHPTTRMCIKAIDGIFSHKSSGNTSCESIISVLDIGTGTGILAICSVLLGAEKCIATDTDPCARTEARQNLEINGIPETRIIICDSDIKQLIDTQIRFDLIAANLRYPTLVSLAPVITGLSARGKYVVLSGMRPDEKEYVIRSFSDAFTVDNEMTENGWSAVTLKRNPS